MATEAATTLYDVNTLAAKHPGLNKGGIRWAIFNAETNGLAASGALIRMGRKVLLDESLFLEWLRGGNAKQAA